MPSQQLKKKTPGKHVKKTNYLINKKRKNRKFCALKRFF